MMTFRFRPRLQRKGPQCDLFNMPNTGLFYLFEVNVQPSRPGSDEEPMALNVQAECLSCHRVTNATAPPSLVNIPDGGAVLECPACGSRQAISAARFMEFSQRSAGGPASSGPPQQ